MHLNVLLHDGDAERRADLTATLAAMGFSVSARNGVVRSRAGETESAELAGDLVGASSKLAQTRRYIERAAKSNANVLIVGEQGAHLLGISRAALDRKLAGQEIES